MNNNKKPPFRILLNGGFIISEKITLPTLDKLKPTNG